MKNEIEINGVKILKKGVKFSGKYFPVWYSHGVDIHGKKHVTIYAKSILTGLPSELGSVKNDSDMSTDYFEKDRAKFFEGSSEYQHLYSLAVK